MAVNVSKMFISVDDPDDEFRFDREGLGLEATSDKLVESGNLVRIAQAS